MPTKLQHRSTDENLEPLERREQREQPSGPRTGIGRKLQTRDLCARYGVSDRTIDRWEADESLGLPRPMRIHNRRYWLEVELDAWDDRQRS